MSIQKIKYPRTPHLPWSPGATSDDKILKHVNHFSDKKIVVTEKMDGENTTIAREYTHARSVNSGYHESRTWIRRLHGAIYHQIPENMRIHGENLFAVHSIKYDSLPNYFLVFGITVDDSVLSWDETELICTGLGLYTVPVLFKGSVSRLEHIKITKSKYGDVAEGYVVRNTDEFDLKHFSSNIAKYVRKGHIQTDDHWMNKKIERNELII